MSTEQKLAIVVRKLEVIGTERMKLRKNQTQQAKESPGIMRKNSKTRVQKMNEIIASYENRAISA